RLRLVPEGLRQGRAAALRRAVRADPPGPPVPLTRLRARASPAGPHPKARLPRNTIGCRAGRSYAFLELLREIAHVPGRMGASPHIRFGLYIGRFLPSPEVRGK